MIVPGSSPAQARRACWPACASSRSPTRWASTAGCCSPGSAPRSSRSSRRTAARRGASARSSTIVPDPERSLFFWNYNRNKRSVVLDLRDARGARALLRLLGGADVLLDASCGALNEALGLDRARSPASFPHLVTARMTPFGDDGPWKDFKGSRPHPPRARRGDDELRLRPRSRRLEYDMPPIAPQIWHAYHIAGEQMAIGDHRGADPPSPHRRGPGRLVRDPRGGRSKDRA